MGSGQAGAAGVGEMGQVRGRPRSCGQVFQTALEFYGDDEEQVEKARAVFSAFSKMETRLKEYERARVIYKVCLLLTHIYLSTDLFSNSLHSPAFCE